MRAGEIGAQALAGLQLMRRNHRASIATAAVRRKSTDRAECRFATARARPNAVNSYGVSTWLLSHAAVATSPE